MYFMHLELQYFNRSIQIRKLNQWRNNMARVKCHDRRKMSVECLHIVLLIQSFTQCFLHTLAVESHSQGENIMLI